MLPDFLILGVQKGGTSSLYYYLSQHHQIRMSFEKEVHFFDLNFGKGIEWYDLQFPNKNEKSDFIIGESSPYYFFHPLVPERVWQLCPNTKLIVMLRNPIDRAYSHFCMQRKKGIEEYDQFEMACNAEKRRIEDENDNFILNTEHISYNHQKFSYLARGLYSVQIERWFKYFSKDNFLFIKSETFFQDPYLILSEVYKFLNIGEDFPNDLSVQNSNDYEQMPLTYRNKLEEYYINDKKRIIQLIGSDFIW